MVSLGDEKRQGGYFFDADPAHVTVDADEICTENVLNSTDTSVLTTPRHRFSKLPTIWLMALEGLLFIGYEIILFLFPYGLDIKRLRGPKSQFYLFAIVHCGFWLISAIVDGTLQYYHRVSRIHGYLKCYRKTRHIRRVPFYCLSAGNTALLLTVVMYNLVPTKTLQLYQYAEIFGSIEFAVCVPSIIYYIVYIWKFNKRRPFPDLDEENILTSGAPYNTEMMTGVRDGNCAEFLEKQADMIRYLQQHNAKLRKKLFKITRDNHVALDNGRPAQNS